MMCENIADNYRRTNEFIELVLIFSTDAARRHSEHKIFVRHISKIYH